MADIEKDAADFYTLTDFLPPGRDEAAVAVSQTNYDRCEVRRLAWNLYSRMKARAEVQQEMLDELCRKLYGTLGVILPLVVDMQNKLTTAADVIRDVLKEAAPIMYPNPDTEQGETPDAETQDSSEA